MPYANDASKEKENKFATTSTRDYEFYDSGVDFYLSRDMHPWRSNVSTEI